ncbi:MAG: heavy-metal-associated domain-containing protein [Sphingobacteriales bacterium]|jgi:copper chaperone CopZ|nr:heavy-metal-associated domain-containing protein [Sphingobacteriales bacterium]MBP9141417.1 heavy-metal-associated domain-containing protein [Chitinophagales bacterium]MDA0197539.1 heavy-metal-associated domain-containing protein [Bacteroidota bacterium]MBK6890575.1 heavy-metal-associated domain-containing protein [Sphingobacteriales bacterium]MBK7526373.1 heavy-metal-associated domain-containing protein [Sphingobacteriales bacterium]
MKITTQTLTINGMGCSNCAKSIETAVAGIVGVQSVAVSFEEKQAAVTFSGENAILQTIIQTITQLGFEVVATTEVN